MNYELIANISDLIGMGSFIFLTLTFAIAPIFNTVNLANANNGLYRLLFGASPERCLISSVFFGYLFIVASVTFIILGCFTTFLEKKAAFFVVTGICGIGLGIIGSIAAYFVYINPDKCNEYELALLFGLFSNYSLDPLDEWKLENRCIEPADCIVPAHNYIQSKCRTPFTVNLAVECASVALIIIATICTTLTQCVLPLNDEDTPVQV